MRAGLRFCCLLAALAFGGAACDRRVALGALGDAGSTRLWEATFEPGDLSEWMADGGGGIYTDGRSGPAVVTQDAAHRGRSSAAASIAPMGLTAWSYLFREQPSPEDAYYGAWFLIPASLEVRSWLSLHHFGYHPTAGSSATSPVWDFHVYPTPAGSLAARLYEASTQRNVEQPSPLAVPVGTWVHFELRYRKAAAATGQITVWQDGTQILDLANAVTAPTDWIQWDVGAGSNDLAPLPGIVYFDDATIGLARAGIDP